MGLFLTTCVEAVGWKRDNPVLTVPAFTAYSEPDAEAMTITERGGVTGWSNPKERIVWYGYFKTAGELRASVRLQTSGKGTAALRLSVARQGRTATWSSGEMARVDLVFGTYLIAAPGYYRFVLEAISRDGPDFGSVETLMLSGPAVAGAHFNLAERRNAASVHLTYPVDKGASIVAFYNEVTVRTDPIWSYYMACGFQRGYFGIQVNSSSERRIIFSVWDSGTESTDRHNVRPEDRVQLLRKGNGVTASDFGNEGTGGHSHRVYHWEKNKTYRFLVTAHPDAGHTTYSGYFFVPESGAWELIASFGAPKDGQFLRGLYSFNENFGGANGQLRRLAEFGNQWVLTSDGQWRELTIARFTHDPTGRENRRDYGAGTKDGRFTLSNGGFAAHAADYGQTFERRASHQPPGDIPPVILH